MDTVRIYNSIRDFALSGLKREPPLSGEYCEAAACRSLFAREKNQE